MGQTQFENFDFLAQVKVQTWLKLFFFFFFLFFVFVCRRFGLGQDEQVKPGRLGKTGQTIVGGDIIHDVMARVSA